MVHRKLSKWMVGATLTVSLLAGCAAPAASPMPPVATPTSVAPTPVPPMATPTSVAPTPVPPMATPTSVAPTSALLSSPPRSGEWIASAGLLGEFVFEVSPDGGSIGILYFRFSEFECGPVTLTGEAGPIEKPTGPVTDGQFAVESSGPGPFAIKIAGAFDEAGTHASGTWEAVHLDGTICSGTWEAR